MITTNEIRVGSAFMFEGSPFIVQRMLGQKGGRAGMVTKLRVKLHSGFGLGRRRKV